MKNSMIKKIENANIDNFTSNIGLKIRKKLHKFISLLYLTIMRFYYKKKIIVDKPFELDKKRCYIFASNHSFFFDGPSIFATIDRNFYTLFGATEQLHLDIRTFFAWLAGMIYVNRFDKQSRQDSVKKMNRVLNAGNSVLIFPEGRWNDSENLLCQKLFAGPYNLSVQNHVEVVPVSVYNETFSNIIYVSYGKPLKLYNYDKDKGLEILRDALATLNYEQIEKYSTKFLRENEDMHYKYKEQRMYEYSKVNWRKNYIWDDELFTYKAGDIDIEDVWKDIDKVHINVYNAHIFGDILVELERRKKYNFVDYMNKNFRKIV